MLTRVAKLLLNEIKKNAPEPRIKRIARVLFRLASGGAYKETVKERFINMFSQVKEIDLISLIYSYAKKKYSYKKVEIDNNATPMKIANIKGALESSKITIYQLGKLANDLISKDSDVRNLSIIQQLASKNSYVEEVLVKKTSSSSYAGSTLFEFIGTFHFGHRRYLRDITDKELNRVLDDLVIGLSAAPYFTLQNRVDDEKGAKYKYVSYENKTGTPMKIAVVFSLEKRQGVKQTVTLITAYPEEKEKPTLQGLDLPSNFRIVERSSEKKEKEELAQKKKLEEQALQAPKPIMQETPKPILIPKPIIQETPKPDLPSTVKVFERKVDTSEVIKRREENEAKRLQEEAILKAKALEEAKLRRELKIEEQRKIDALRRKEEEQLEEKRRIKEENFRIEEEKRLKRLRETTMHKPLPIKRNS
jgi:hypothetical protein